MTIEATLLDFIKSEYDSNKPAVLAAIQASEGGAEGFLINAIDNAPKPAGLLGTLFVALRPQLDGYIKTLVQANPEVVFDFIDAELATEAKALGG